MKLSNLDGWKTDTFLQLCLEATKRKYLEAHQNSRPTYCLTFCSLVVWSLVCQPVCQPTYGGICHNLCLSWQILSFKFNQTIWHSYIAKQDIDQYEREMQRLNYWNILRFRNIECACQSFGTMWSLQWKSRLYPVINNILYNIHKQ